jgi:hypothetical protein
MEEKNWDSEFTTELICEEDLLIDMHPIDLCKQIEQSIVMFEQHMKKTRTKLVGNSKLSHTRKVIKYRKEFNKVMNGWSVWSGKFNRFIRERLANLSKSINTNALQRGDESAIALNEVRIKLSYVYAYWWNRFDYLQTQVSGFTSLKGRSTKAGINRGKITLSDLIDGSVDYNKLSAQFRNLLDRLTSLDSDTALTELKKKGENNVRINSN